MSTKLAAGITAHLRTLPGYEGVTATYRQTPAEENLDDEIVLERDGRKFCVRVQLGGDYAVVNEDVYTDEELGYGIRHVAYDGLRSAFPCKRTVAAIAPDLTRYLSLSRGACEPLPGPGRTSHPRTPEIVAEAAPILAADPRAPILIANPAPHGCGEDDLLVLADPDGTPWDLAIRTAPGACRILIPSTGEEIMHVRLAGGMAGGVAAALTEAIAEQAPLAMPAP